MTALSERIGYFFKDESLLDLALTHPSVNNEQNNQRLEFLGDAILGASIAHLLYVLYPDAPEGELARRQAGLVRRETLAAVAKSIDLGDSLKMSSGEERSGGRKNTSNLEDALEALIGALYLDGGMSAAETFLLPRWKELAISMQGPPKDAKTALQEWAQGRGLPIPSYTLLQSSGPAHAPTFIVEAKVEGYEPECAEAAAKRAAEQAAAETLLKRLESL